MTMPRVSRWLFVVVAISIGLGAWLMWPRAVKAQGTVTCDPTTTCFDVSLPAGLIGDFYLDET